LISLLDGLRIIDLGWIITAIICNHF
jgi:hypothetical protein